MCWCTQSSPYLHHPAFAKKRHTSPLEASLFACTGAGTRGLGEVRCWCLHWSPFRHHPAFAKKRQTSPDFSGWNASSWVWAPMCSCLHWSPFLHHPALAKKRQTSPDFSGRKISSSDCCSESSMMCSCLHLSPFLHQPFLAKKRQTSPDFSGWAVSSWVWAPMCSCLHWSPFLHHPALAKKRQTSPDFSGWAVSSWVWAPMCSCLHWSPFLHHPALAKKRQTSPDFSGWAVSSWVWVPMCSCLHWSPFLHHPAFAKKRQTSPDFCAKGAASRGLAAPIGDDCGPTCWCLHWSFAARCWTSFQLSIMNFFHPRKAFWRLLLISNSNTHSDLFKDQKTALHVQIHWGYTGASLSNSQEKPSVQVEKSWSNLFLSVERHQASSDLDLSSCLSINLLCIIKKNCEILTTQTWRFNLDFEHFSSCLLSWQEPCTFRRPPAVTSRRSE